ncbi:MAG: hypothetical protein ACREMX_14655 [Gemmatimonadales bacterium]
MPDPLSDRVRARVAEVALTLDDRSRASRPRSKRPRRQKAGVQPAVAPQMTTEVRSLRRVFHELGTAYRQHRRQTGQHVSPAVRDAAIAFKQAPSLKSLVVVAAFLDEDGILAW